MNNSISNKEIDFSYILNQIESQKKQIQNIINKWKKENKIKKEVDFNYIENGKSLNRIDSKILLEKWNNDIQTIKGENLSFIVDNMKIKEKEIDDLLTYNNEL